jgi:hypothetical protein
MNTDQLTTKAEEITIDLDSPLVFHIGWMRTGTTFLQGVFENHADIQLSLKNRFFSYDPYYLLGRDHYKTLIQDQGKNCQHKIIVDSDENYAMGRFKTHLREKSPGQKYNYKAELSYIHHDISEMILRIKEVAPNAKIFGVVRKQANWFESVYKHDVYHFGLDKPFEKFYESELGKAYRKAADYFAVIKAFQEAFGKDNVKIMLFEDFVQSQSQFVDDLSEFLGLDIAIDPTQKLKKNASTSGFFTQLHQKANLLSETNPGYSERKFYELLRSVIYRFDHLVNKRGWRLPGQVISKTMKQRIYAEYQESNNKLGKLLNKEIELKKYGYFQ